MGKKIVKKPILAEIPRVEDVISDGEGGLKIDWEKFVELQKLSNSHDVDTCLKAHKDLGMCVTFLIEHGVLSRGFFGSYSVFQPGSYDSRNRMDPHVSGDFYSFTRKEYAKEYLAELKNEVPRGGLFVYKWPRV